jgi:hypothetical protein
MMANPLPGKHDDSEPERALELPGLDEDVIEPGYRCG